MGVNALETLKAMGYSADFKHYPMDHEVCLEEIADISVWLQSVLK